MTIICKYCNKEYASSSSRSNHIKRYHTNKSESPLTAVNKPQIIVNQMLTAPSTNTINEPLNNGLDVNKSHALFICKNCNCTFTTRQGKWKHNKKCKSAPPVEDIIALLREENDKKIALLKEENDKKFALLTEENKKKDKFIEMLTLAMNKQCKIHPKTLQKINKQLNTTNNTIINNNNNVTNNVINLIGFGREELNDVLTKKEKINVLKNKFMCLDYIVKHVHFNDKYPQFKNIKITNTQNAIAYKYDNDAKKYIAIDKDELLREIIDERMSDVSTFYETYVDELDSKTIEAMEKILNKINNNDTTYINQKKNDIKLIIYNNRDKVPKEVLSNTEIIV